MRRLISNRIRKDPPPPPPDGPRPLILVVGNDTAYKSSVAGALAVALGATKQEPTTKAGVRVFTRESKELFPSPVVMDTVTLTTTENCPPADIARVWISQNSLRKLSGKLVFVICVITPTDSVYQQPDEERDRCSWLSVLACIFEKHKQVIMILVNSEDNIVEASRKKLRDVLNRDGFKNTKNIWFASQREVAVGLILRHTVTGGIGDEKTSTKTTSAVAPFHLPEVSPNASVTEKFGPWGPENVILFGRSGSGKSTLAQMLTLGRLDALSKKFSSSSSIRGETRTVNNGQGRGWRVIDTPGLGEANDDAKSTISTNKAAILIFKHLLLVEGMYCHYLYVWKKARVEDIDTRLWSIFVNVVGEDLIKDHSTVVVSDADDDWFHENLTHLKKCFEGCESFVTAEFPPIAAGDDEYEKLLQEIRLESLIALEDELASLCRIDTCCKFGGWSKSTQQSLVVRGVENHPFLRPSIRQSPAFGPTAAEERHPSDWETARIYIKLNSAMLTMGTFLSPSKAIDLRNDVKTARTYRKSKSEMLGIASVLAQTKAIGLRDGSLRNECLRNDPSKGKKEAESATASSPVVEPVTNDPATHGTVSGSPDKVKGD